MAYSPSTTKQKAEVLSVVHTLSDADVETVIRNYETGYGIHGRTGASSDDIAEYIKERHETLLYVYEQWYRNLCNQHKKYASHPEDLPYYNELGSFLKDSNYSPESFAAREEQFIHIDQKKYPILENFSPLFDKNGEYIMTERIWDNIPKRDRLTECRIYLTPQIKSSYNVAKLLINKSRELGTPLEIKMHEMGVDSMVIYTNYQDFDKTLRLILAVKKDHPEFFDGAMRPSSFGKIDDGIYFGEDVPPERKGSDSYSAMRSSQLKISITALQKEIADTILDGQKFNFINNSWKKTIDIDFHRSDEEYIMSSVLGAQGNLTFLLGLGSGDPNSYIEQCKKLAAVSKEENSASKKIYAEIYDNKSFDKFLLKTMQHMGIADSSLKITDQNRDHIYEGALHHMLFAGKQPEDYDLVMCGIENVINESNDKELKKIIKNLTALRMFTDQYYMSLACAFNGHPVKSELGSLDITKFHYHGKEYIVHDIGSTLYKIKVGHKPPKMSTDAFPRGHVCADMHLFPINEETKQELVTAGIDPKKHMGSQSLQHYMMKSKNKESILK